MPDSTKETEYCGKQVPVYQQSKPPAATGDTLQVSGKTVLWVWSLAYLWATHLAELIKAGGTTRFLPGEHLSTEKSAVAVQQESLM